MKFSDALRGLRAQWVAASLLALSACGGGGGGGDGGIDPVPQDPASRALVLSSANQSDVASSGVGSAESLLQLGQLAVDQVLRARNLGPTASVALTCVNGGLVTITLRDRDSNGQPSAGDRVDVDMQDCGFPLLGSVLAGTLTIDLTAATAAPAESLTGSVALGAAGVALSDAAGPLPGVSIRLFGALAFEWTRSDFNTLLRVRSTGADDMRLVASGNGKIINESWRAIDLSKDLRYADARSVISLTLTVRSEALGGSFDLSTPQPLTAYLNTYPEAGRVELRGAGGAVLRLRPRFVTASEQFDLELDANGDGAPETTSATLWDTATEGFLWWDSQGTLGWASNPYTTQSFRTTDFSYRGLGSIGAGVNQVYRLQFSRPPAQLPNWTFRLRDNGPVQGYSPQTQDVAADVVQRGALVLVKPRTQLRHGRNYSLEFSVDGGLTWFTPATLVDALGNSVTVYYGLASFATPDTMRAVISANGSLLASSTSTVQLGSANSVSTLRPIASTRWTQISGPPLTIGSPDAATTSVTWGPTPPTGIESATLELEITDSAGEKETSRITLMLFNQVAAGRVLYFRGAAGDYISGGATVLVGDFTGNLSANPVNSGYLGYNYNEANFAAWWYLNLATADGAPLRVGAYENAVRAPFHGNQNGLELSGSGRGCNQIYGRFDVLELATDAQGVITTLAVDFEQHCETPQSPALLGSLRINSSLPLRP